MRSLWRRFARAVACAAFLSTVGAYSTITEETVTMLEDTWIPVKTIDFSNPPQVAPKYYRRETRRFPDTLFGTLMNEYCAAYFGPTTRFACSDVGTLCSCFGLKESTADSVGEEIVRVRGDGSRYTLFGLPYAIRRATMNLNCVGSKFADHFVKLTDAIYLPKRETPAEIYLIDSALMDSIVQDYKERPLRGEDNRYVKDVLDTYRTDPTSALFSDMYYVYGYEPQEDVEGTAAYKKALERMERVKAKSLNPTGDAAAEVVGTEPEDEGDAEGEGVAEGKSVEVPVTPVAAPQTRDNQSATPTKYEKAELEKTTLDLFMAAKGETNDAAARKAAADAALAAEPVPGSTFAPPRGFEYCNAWDIFAKRHGRRLGNPECETYATLRCGHSPMGTICPPVVQTRFYHANNQEFYIYIDHFTYSPTFAVYLTPQQFTCGSEESFKDMISYMPRVGSKGVTSLEEITVGNRRIFKAGPFTPKGKVGTYNICACLSHDSEREVNTCLYYNEYRRKIGTVVLYEGTREQPTHKPLDTTIRIKAKDKHVIVLERDRVSHGCRGLFDAAQYDFKKGIIHPLPSFAEHMKFLKPNSAGNLSITFDKAGSYRICIVDPVTAEVESMPTRYYISGIKDTSETIVYRTPDGRFVVSPVLVQKFGPYTPSIDSILVVDSESDCTAPPVAVSSGKLQSYYRREVISSGYEYMMAGGMQLTASAFDERQSYRICVQYEMSTEPVPIGHARMLPYFDLADAHMAGSLFHQRPKYDDAYNWVVGEYTRVVHAWIYNMRILSLSFDPKTPKQVDNFNYFLSILEGASEIVVHFRVYTDKNLVTMWLMSDADPNLYPFHTFEVPRPLSVRIGMAEGRPHLYVLVPSGAVVAYSFTTLLPAYTLADILYESPYKLEAPRYMDVVQMKNDCKVVVIDSATSGLHVYDRFLNHRFRLFHQAGVDFWAAGRVACLAHAHDVDYASCFVAMPLSNEIVWVTVMNSDHSVTITGRYVSGQLVDDLDPVMGAPVSLFATPSLGESANDIDVIFLRDSGEHGAVVRLNLLEKRFKFVTPLADISGGSFVRDILPCFCSQRNRSVMVLHEHYEKEPLTSLVKVEEVFERVNASRKSNFTLSWVPSSSLLPVPDAHYSIPEHVIVKTKYVFTPIPKDSEPRFPVHVKYSLEFNEPADKELIKRAVVMGPDGELTVESTKALKITFTVLQRVMWNTRRIPVTLQIMCNDGEYYNGNECVLCPIGHYNSISAVSNDVSLLTRCTACPTHQTTIGLGAKSLNQCACIAGYTLVEGEDGTSECKPCAQGSYKFRIGMEKCVDSCKNNAYSRVIGSTSGVGLYCRCYPGYYLGTDDEHGNDCLPCEEGYYCVGGYKAKQQKCPSFTTTATLAAKSLEECVCVPGYHPADPERIKQEGTYEHSLASRIMTAYHVTDLNTLVCVPCPYNSYKSLAGSSACAACPDSTYAGSSGSTSITQCNRCMPGYYETNDPGRPCEICPPNTICVGSDPLSPDMKIYGGMRIKCHKNSITLAPYENNVHMNSCLCDKGHTVQEGRSGLIKCEAVPKNTFKDVIGNVAPTECPHGSYTLITGAISVSECICKKGLFFDKVKKRCTVCPAGKYCPGGSLTNGEHTMPMTCKDANAVTKDPGASSPRECLCKPGYYMRPDGLGGCIACPENTYKGFISNEHCTECDRNSMTNGKVGATSREQCVCSPGFFFDRGCEACRYTDKYCPGGTVMIFDNASAKEVPVPRSPVQCPPNTEIPPGVDTADSVDSCKCGKGYAFSKKDDDLQDKVCTPCAPGSYKSSIMDSSCNGLCTQNATSMPGAVSPSQCFCLPGYYYLAGGICAPCAEGASCEGGLVSSRKPAEPGRETSVSLADHVKPVPIKGYYLDKIHKELRMPDDWKFIKCPIKGACLGEKGCSPSMTGYMCAECKMGYTNNFTKGAICSKCPSTGRNLLLTVLWYLGLLLVNIVMACLNVSAGFNRRSIHSVVIKIALNYGICMSVLNVIDFNELALPPELKSITLRWFKMMYREDKAYYTSVDCLLQDWFGMKHADSFFYSMLFIACLPLILLLVVTVLMWVILALFKIKRHHTTRSKLALLHQSRVQGMQYLADRLHEEYANERLFLIFRYIPLPGETMWIRFKHFLEDMIPIYVTVLFSVHGNTTSQMLSLLDCTCINLGQSIPSKYVLRPAMSIKCSLDRSMGYIPYMLLGFGGLVFWGFGIPFFSFMVLYLNRKNLYAPDVRMKYGFLHNGYQQDYWYWEAVVFTRKSLVLVIASIVIVPSQNTSGSRIWMALSVAIVFLTMQLIYTPFDERDYFVLGRLESHSMISWTANLLAVSLMCYLTMTPLVTTVLCAFLFTNSCYFLYVVLKSGASAFLIAIKHKREKMLSSKLGRVVACLLFFESRRNSREPLISYSQSTSKLQLKLQRKRRNWLGRKSMALKSLERYYFVNIVTELYRIVVCRLKLDVMPKLFIEFLVRLSLSFAKFEEKMSNKELFKDLADGDLSRLVAWATEKESRKLHKIVKLDSLDGGRSIPNIGLDDESLSATVGLRREELQYIMDCLFDDKVLVAKTNLSDFYHSLTRIWIMETDMLTFLFSVFKHVKQHRAKECLDDMEKSNAKLQKVQAKLQRVVDGDDGMEHFDRTKNVRDMEARLHSLVAEQDILRTSLKQMQADPDSYTPPEEQIDNSLDAMMKEFGFNVRGALEKYVADFQSSSGSEYTTDDSESESDSDSETETDSDSEYTTDDSSSD